MPWHQVLRLTHWIIGLQCAIIGFMVFMLAIQLRTSPEQVLNEIKTVHTEIKVGNDRFSQAITVNQKEIERLKKEMQTKTEQLRQANEALKKLDPKFIPFPIETLQAPTL